MYFQFGSRIYEGERRGKRKRRRRITSEEKYTSLYNIERKEALGIPPAVNINFETVSTRAKRKGTNTAHISPMLEVEPHIVELIYQLGKMRPSANKNHHISMMHHLIIIFRYII